MERAEYRSATRILSSVLSGVEKRVLVALATRMPHWINSDHLTALGLVAMLGAGLSFWLAGSVPGIGLPLVAVCLAVNWFGDSLDGTVARVRKCERPRYGYYVDHMCDAFGALFLLGGLALSGYMSPVIAAGLLLAYYLLSIEIYLAANTIGEFRITYFLMGPTELRILLAIGALWLLVKPVVTIFGVRYRLFDVGGAVAVAGMLILVVLTTIRHTRQLWTPLDEPIADLRRGDLTGVGSTGETMTDRRDKLVDRVANR